MCHRLEKEMRAFEGPNGWYLAAEDEDGFHRQPADGGHLTAEEAEEALASDQDQDDDEPQYWGGTDRPEGGA